jgi:hypothetical protein
VPRVGHSPAPCGHDHDSAAVTTVAADTIPLARALTTAITTTVDPVPVIMTVHTLAARFASPPDDSFSRRLSASLRI